MMAAARMQSEAPFAVVLSADDGTARRIAYWLNAAGHVAVTAPNGFSARAHIHRDTVRLLVTDRLLPPWPGLDTIVSLKLEFPDLKVAFLGDGVPDNQRLATSAGADLILPTPLRRANILEAALLADLGGGRLACAS